jgi:GNAT superfamily N-acetyltransferase
MASSEFAVRRLSLADVPGLIRLSDEAGWNQTAEDWQLLLSQGHGWGLWYGADGPFASALALPYGDEFAWISMVLVTEQLRRQGIATRLTAACLEELDERGLEARLDATAAGQEVYVKLGFTPGFTFTRWQAEKSLPRGVAADSFDVVRATGAELDQLTARDAAAFGADRSALLAMLLARRPEQAWMTTAGFVMARDGHRALQLGPLIAENDAAAATLLARALEGVIGPVFVDAIDGNDAFDAALGEAGFTRQRQFARMRRGGSGLVAPKGCYVIAGPEFG